MTHPNEPSRARHYAILTPHIRAPPGALVVGLSRFELLTPRLSSVCSNQLSYRPGYSFPGAQPRRCLSETRASEFLKEPSPVPSKLDRRASCQTLKARSIIELAGRTSGNSRKEVIQPQVLLQLPCYDFTPITGHTLGTSLPCGLVWRLLVQPAFVM